MICEHCATPYEEPLMKWNNGNPVLIDQPFCDCEEKITEARIEEILENARKKNKT